MSNDDLVLILDDQPESGNDQASRSDGGPAWRILVVDDDADVHETTAFALNSLEVAGRPVELLHAMSAAEGVALLRRETDVAVALLDVVMETDDAGLRMVETIRNELGLRNLRIILRTGQPGQAPELETIRAYDINDYKTKSELTRHRLYASLTTAVRSYDQLRKLEASRRGLEQIIAASNQFIAEQGMQSFAEGVITQIAALLGVEPEGVVCAGANADDAELASETTFVVIAAAGRFRHLMARAIGEIDERHIVDNLSACLRSRNSVVDSHSVTLYFHGAASQDFAAYIGARAPLKEVDRELLEIFCTNIALCASNVSLVRRMRELAYVDRMLGLPNRTAFIEYIDELLAEERMKGMVLAKVDIDHFGETNDMLGYRYGDALLVALARRFELQLGGYAYVARLGGNTFGVLGRDEDVTPDALRAVFQEAFEIGGVPRRVSASIGVVRCDEVQVSCAPELIEQAFIALKRAKAQGNGRVEYYTHALGADAKDRTRLLQGLHRAFDHDRLFIVYQPKLDLRTRRTVGVEALMRWRAEDGSLIPPDRFIPVAEQSGLIVGLGAWALRTALSAVQELDNAGFGDIRMGVNVSAVQFAQPEFLADLDMALASKGVDPRRLELEVTESVALMGMDRVVSLLDEVRARKVAVSIDDFGTGFSSLSYLDQLPADRIKIDRSFVDHLETDRRGARIARLIVPLGHQLGMKVVAEGVETEGQLEALLELGCDEAQGYLFARPMPLDELLAWLGSRPEDRVAEGEA